MHHLFLIECFSTFKEYPAANDEKETARKD